MVSAIITVLLIIASVVLDQVSKLLVVANMELGQSIDVIPGIFRFTYIHNEGAAFGSMADSRWIFMILSSVAIIAILVYMFWKKPQSKLLRAALILVAGGGIGNMIDRIFLGYVIDFLDFCAFPNLWMWIFNVADACVCIGAGLLALWMILDIIKDEKAKKAAVNALTDKGNTDVTDADENENGDENA
ncbi:MAG: signal peptidase II [Clostridia bacterium]|nr:signal peptidase II [Clostridia bacterium]